MKKKVETFKTSIELPRFLYEKLRYISAEHDITLNELMVVSLAYVTDNLAEKIIDVSDIS
jgi:predicted DNA-binding ribbon-helix-helix protein